MSQQLIDVEVVYALPQKQRLIALQVPEGTTMLEAAERSGITEHFPELELDKMPMGIFGKAEGNPKKRVLQQGERVEIYRPLKIDPKESRKARAKKASKP